MIATWPLPDVPAVIEAALEGLVLVDLLMIESGIVPPYPHDANVIYKIEPPGEEVWKNALDVVREGWGDCEDLAAWVAAGHRYTGTDAGASVVLCKTGVNKLHAVVLRSDGAIDDPSHELKPRKAG